MIESLAGLFDPAIAALAGRCRCNNTVPGAAAVPKHLSTAHRPINRPSTGPQASQGASYDGLAGKSRSDPHPNRVHASHLAPIADAECYIDTLELSFPRRPKGLLAEAHAIMKRKIWFEDVKDANGTRWAARLICHQPSRELLHALDKYQGILSRLDIAFDIWPRNMSTDDLATFIRCNTILRWRREGRMHDHETTAYWCEQHQGIKRPDRNLAEYHDRPSKLRSDPAAVVHLELRLQSAEAIKREGFSQVSDLANLDPRQLLDKHIRLLDFQRHIAEDIASSDQGRRVKGFYDRFYRSRAQLFKDRQPHLSAKLATLNGSLILGNALTWGARSGSRDHLTWIPLGSANTPSSVLYHEEQP